MLARGWPTEPAFAPVSGTWGEWCLGDLSDTLRRACSALGPSMPASWVEVAPPEGPRRTPFVQMIVPTRAVLEQAGRDLTACDPAPFFMPETSERRLVVELEDWGLHIWSSREAGA